VNRAAAASGLAWCLALLALLAGSACSSGPRGDAPPAPRPVGQRWEHFPDIPMPAGWKPLAGEDHLAIAIANGAARRLSVALQAPAARSELQPPEALTRYVGSVLGDTGWTRIGDGRLSDVEQRWSKAGETLEVSAKRIDGLVVIRWRLAP
jgi:hypothetical protein